MRIDVLTLFPELFHSFEQWSIVGRAIDKGLFSLGKINIRDFSMDRHRRVDDYPFGGGPGMIMGVQPIYDSIMEIRTENSKVIYLSPQGKTYNQEMASSLSREKHLILLCGHYEGVDNRIIDNFVDLEISIGDYVLTGGELPAMVLIESIIRLIPNVLSSKESYTEESHYVGLLEHPQYTRPRTFRGLDVPEILLSGNHKKIAEWKKYQALKATYIKRSDLLDNIELTHEELEMLDRIKKEVQDKN